MTDSFRKRKWAGEPMKDKRKADPGPLKLPPHKKPKVWTLAVELTVTSTTRYTKAFTSKIARDDARAKIEKFYNKPVPLGKCRYYSWYDNHYAGFSHEESQAIKAGPTYTETYEDGSDPLKGEKP